MVAYSHVTCCESKTLQIFKKQLLMTVTLRRLLLSCESTYFVMTICKTRHQIIDEGVGPKPLNVGSSREYHRNTMKIERGNFRLVNG